VSCLFCNIIEKKIPATVVYEDDTVLAFKDISPQAPIHILVIPKQHFATLNELTDQDCEIIGRLPLVARKIAKEMDFAEDGYRVVMNCNQQGGQTVYHIHMHLLAGRAMKWPPG